MKDRSHFKREVIHFKGFAPGKLDNCASILPKKPSKFSKICVEQVKHIVEWQKGPVTVYYTILARQPRMFLAVRSEAGIIEL